MAKESFKERVRLEIIKAAKKYKEVYVDCEYLICSEAFVKKDYYIIAAKEDNFQHLTGVHSQINAQSFFDMCYEGTLSEKDFDFVKRGQDEKDVKGTVRRKIKVLPDIMGLFKAGLQAEESFKKNKVICSFATADGNCTLGFSESEKARPKSLIKGNELKNPRPVELILKRKTGTELFDEIVVGNSMALSKYKENIEKLVASDLFYTYRGEHMLNEHLILKMIEFDKGDPKRIQHFTKVYEYAHVIGKLEGLDEKKQKILDIAAILHDIGIRPSEEKYGRCDGKLQEQEGPAYARKMLEDFLEVTKEEIDRVCYLIGHHHTYMGVDGEDYQILLEADFLVNAYEDELSPESICTFRENVFRTKTGTELLNIMYNLKYS